MSCRICARTAHGFHFGVRSCRACAAFFRRYALSKWTDAECRRKSSQKDKCLCRPCRIKKCLLMGMETKNFQYDRGALLPSFSSVTPSPAIFIGRPEYLMFSDPISNNTKVFIDVNHLLLEASRLLNQGCESPIQEENQLKKLSLGSSILKFDVDKMRFFEKIGQSELIDIIEYYFVTVVKWIIRFDEFQKLNREYQMTLLQSIWHVWMKTHKCSATAGFRNSSHYKKPKQKIFRNVCVDTDIAKVDTSWMSDYSHEYFHSYLRSQAVYEFDTMEAIRKLNPSEVELTFIFATICFEYAGKRHQGELLKITDHFQQVLSNDLHNYYTEEAHNPRYSKRVADLMKINNMIQKSIWTSRPQRELNRVFNVMKIGFSHPTMFEDSLFH